MADEHKDQIRIVQETVAGKEITFAHIMGGPAPIIYQKLGLNPQVDYGSSAIGIMNMTPSESAVIASDIAVKSGNVYLGFADRFTGTMIITGEISDVMSALTEIVDAVPVFSRRIRLKTGMPWLILSMALGRAAGAWMHAYFGYGWEQPGLFVRLGMKFCPLVVPGKTALCISICKGCLFEEAIFSISGICPFLDLISGIPELFQFHTGLLHGFCQKSELPVFV